MKKTVLLILFTILASSVFAKTGVGVAYSFIDLDTGAGNAVINLSHKAIPGTILGISANITDTNTSISLYDDWWLYNSNLIGAIDLYLGPGFFIGFSKAKDQDATFNAGARLPIGLRFFPATPIELFLEVAPSITPITEAGVTISGDSVFFQGAFGIRFWF